MNGGDSLCIYLWCDEASKVLMSSSMVFQLAVACLKGFRKFDYVRHQNKSAHVRAVSLSLSLSVLVGAFHPQVVSVQPLG